MNHSPFVLTSKVRNLRICFHIFVLSILFGGTSAAAPWYEHYAKGEQALERQNWTEAIAQLNQALERKGDSGARVRTYGMKVVSYFPYFKLGVAYYELGQWDAALQAFETEERLEAISRSENDLAELRRFRDLALGAREDAAAEATTRIRQIVDDSLAEARRLEDQGRFEEATAVVGRALAVAEEDPEANAALDRLKNRIAEEDRRRQRQEGAARLVAEGRARLEQGSYREASSLFREAVALEPNDEVQTLLERAQSSLRAEIRAIEDEEAQQELMSDAFRQAEEFFASGSTQDALDQLESVFALDPDNLRARELQNRLLEAQLERTRNDTVRRLLDNVAEAFEAGRFEQSLATANRILATEPGNVGALDYVARAYREINRRLLGSGTAGNIPPAIRFADFRSEMDDGSRVQSVETAEFRLSGVVIDDSPVEITFYDRENREVQVEAASQPLGEYYLTEFHFDYTLPAGLSTFRLVATDEGSSSSSSEYIVVYEQPFYRSPWMIALVVALGVAAMGLVYGQRARERERLLRRRFNPYIAGAPVLDENLFFGRDQLLDRILQTIHNNSLLLYGERRIGKTSVQHQLKKRLSSLKDPSYQFFPVFIDLQGTPEDRFFATMAEDIFLELAPFVDGLEPHPSIHTDYGYREFVHDLRKVIKTLKQQSEKHVKLVLLMDEVDELNDYDPRVNQKLRSLFMKSFAENLVSVVSGVEIKKHWEREGSPWYNFFEEIEIKPFGRMRSSSSSAPSGESSSWKRGSWIASSR